MRNKSDKLPKGKKLLITAVLSAVVILLSLLCIEKRIKNFSEEMGTYYCRAQASEVISGSVRDIMEQTGAEYSDLSTDVYDQDGRLVSTKLCSKNVNILQSMIISEINSRIEELSESEVKVSAGTLSGFFLFNGYGPEIKFRLLPVGSAYAELKSEFESGGINQTCHKISLDITAEIKAVYPTGSETVTVSMNCIIAENIISGEVPNGIMYPAL